MDEHDGRLRPVHPRRQLCGEDHSRGVQLGNGRREHRDRLRHAPRRRKSVDGQHRPLPQHPRPEVRGCRHWGQPTSSRPASRRTGDLDAGLRAAQGPNAAVEQSPTRERLPVPHLTKARVHDRSPRASVTAAIAMAACTHRRSRASWHRSLLEAATRGHDRSRRCRQGTRQGSARRSATPLCRSTPVGVRRGGRCCSDGRAVAPAAPSEVSRRLESWGLTPSPWWVARVPVIANAGGCARQPSEVAEPLVADGVKRWRDKRRAGRLPDGRWRPHGAPRGAGLVARPVPRSSESRCRTSDTHPCTVAVWPIAPRIAGRRLVY